MTVHANNRVFKQLSQEEREKIFAFYHQGKSFRSIAQAIGRHHTTVIREIKRNGKDPGREKKTQYSPSYAHAQYLIRKKQANRNHIILRKDQKQRERIHSLLKEKGNSRGPDEIIGRLRQEGHKQIVSTSTLYRFIRTQQPMRQKFLRHKERGYRHKKNEKRNTGFLVDIPFIDNRPQGAQNRTQKGHIEFDTIISNRSVKGGAITGVDRYSRYIFIRKIHSLQADVIHGNMKYMLRHERGKIHSITIDNGREFAGVRKLVKDLGVMLFRCHPYSSREKGTNERHNGMTRWFLPKGCDISLYTDKEIQEIQDKLNHKPRKKLGYKTPYELYHEIELSYIKS